MGEAKKKQQKLKWTRASWLLISTKGIVQCQGRSVQVSDSHLLPAAENLQLKIIVPDMATSARSISWFILLGSYLMLNY